MALKNLFEKNRIFFQMAYGVFLIILIPIFVVFNTIYIVNKYNDNVDTIIQRHGLSTGRFVYSLIKKDIENHGILQKEVDFLTSKNSDILEISILKPSEEKFKVVASSNEDNINRTYKYEYYDLAWVQPDNDGLATDLKRPPIDDDGNFEQIDDGRFWLIAMPMDGPDGNKSALLTIQLSSEIVDSLTSETRTSSIYVLVITVLVLLLFLMVAVRLWDYALLYKKMREIDKMKDEFISMASHELRTPVSAIRGYASMIVEGSYGKVNDEIKSKLSNIDSSAKRLDSLVEDLLEVSSIEQGRIKVDLLPTDVNKIINKTIENLMVKAKEKGLLLKYSPHTEKSLILNVDGDKLEQILINLIGNAIKYTKEGSVEVFTEYKKRGNRLEIKIKDSGIGMSSEERKDLFSKFYRIKNEKTKDISGTGLGLWITKELVTLMNGRVDVDSIENVGTQITVSFPMYKIK